MATDKGQEDNDLQNTTQETKDKQHDLDIMYKILHRKLKKKQHDLDIMYFIMRYQHFSFSTCYTFKEITMISVVSCKV